MTSEAVEEINEAIDKFEKRAAELVNMEQEKPLSKENHLEFIKRMGDAYLALGMLKNTWAMFEGLDK